MNNDDDNNDTNDDGNDGEENCIGTGGGVASDGDSERLLLLQLFLTRAITLKQRTTTNDWEQHLNNIIDSAEHPNTK